MSRPNARRVAVIGGGPAGLMAAETLAAAGCAVDVYDAMPNCGRKFLIAGLGGLNLTHAEAFAPFVARYGGRADMLQPMLEAFGAAQLRDWAKGLGIDTFVGSSQRVFPTDLKAAPLLRGWLRRLREAGVRFHLRHRWTGWNADGALQFDGPDGALAVTPDATVLALGGGSWRRLGSDGRWAALLAGRGIDIAPLQPSNCGFEAGWSAI
ncbi:MAG: TIGR03862 family flavoprotein, partial [Nevskia sp.]|uniref:TIGR03862 family flavoprotein n=1 Tax=Nevskia sp. TaxID=1929292 RepID=UPI004036FADA